MTFSIFHLIFYHLPYTKEYSNKTWILISSIKTFPTINYSKTSFIINDEWCKFSCHIWLLVICLSYFLSRNQISIANSHFPSYLDWFHFISFPFFVFADFLSLPSAISRFVWPCPHPLSVLSSFKFITFQISNPTFPLITITLQLTFHLEIVNLWFWLLD